MTSSKEKLSLEEIKNSKRWFKSATPKYTIDWYIKWVSSVFLLTAMSTRGVPELQYLDLTFSIIGVLGWLIVSLIWEDRALIVLNAIGLVLLLKNLFQAFLI